MLAGYTEALAAGRFVDSLGLLARAGATEPPTESETLFLLPADAELSELERLVLERLAGDRLRRLPVDEPPAWNARAATNANAAGNIRWTSGATKIFRLFARPVRPCCPSF